MITSQELQAFFDLRNQLFDAITEELKDSGHHKSYEGALGIEFPPHPNMGYDLFEIKLSCYVIGPARHYSWTGKTFSEALSKAQLDINSWIAEAKQQDKQDF